jgi:7,8-dihydroneopterin aldolase/epimerase/oxygenase
LSVIPLPHEPAAPEPEVRAEMSKVFVRGLRLDIEIGAYAHEFGRTQPLVIDVELDAPVAGAQALGDVVNYEKVVKAAKAIAAEGHIDLVETFAERLARACLADPRVTRAHVRVEKPQALAPDADAAGVELTLVKA